MPAKLSKVNQSVEKAIQIIEVMAREGTPMRLQDIALRTDLPASTALRMVNTLLVYGYINQDPDTLRYSLSLKFAQIGSVVASQFSLRQLAHPYLVELSHRCQESCCLAVEENMELVYTDVVDGPHSMLRIMQMVGKRAPLHATGIGKLLLLNYSPEQLDEFIRVRGLPAITPNTACTKTALLKQLEQIRAQGYALDAEEYELGARCVAAPIYDYTGLVVAGVCISGPASRLPESHIEEIIPAVKETAVKISHLLAYPTQCDN